MLKSEYAKKYFRVGQKFVCRAFGGVLPLARGLAQDTRPKSFDELINGGGVYLDGFFVFHEGELAGYCLVGKGFSPECGGKVVWIEEIYLREPFRSKGIGRSLFAEIFKRYGETKRFRLEVEPSNARAASLYTSLGFKKLNYVQYIFEPIEN